MRRVAGPWLAIWLALAAPACAPSASDLASFLDTPYGDISAGVTQLEGAELDELMSELMLRLRSYLALRDAIPFTSLAPERCILTSEGAGSDFSFEADANCVFGEEFAPAEGVIVVTQELLPGQPQVTRLTLEYRQVVLGSLTVDGREEIVETEGSGGASVRALTLTQDGWPLEYEFRLGLLDGEVPVFDYQIATAGGDVLARISNPTTPGGFVSVILSGLDGALYCEVRDSAWAPGDPARGQCDSGAVFGLPR